MSIDKNKDVKNASESAAQTDFPIKNEIDKNKQKGVSKEPPVKNSLNDSVKNIAAETNGLNEDNLEGNGNLLLGDQ